MRVLCAACIAALLTTPCVAEMKAPIHTETGAVSGVAGRDAAITVFKGIPYAEPPVGSMRWKPPVPMSSWKGVRKATAYGPACFQPLDKGKSIYSENPMPMSEDCLTLNIWAQPSLK